MRVRRRIVLAVFGLAFGLSLLAASSAWASYTVTPFCTTGGQTAQCSTGWYTTDVTISWTWTPMDGSNPISGCVPHSYVQNASETQSCTVSGPSGEGSATQPINVEISDPVVGGSPTRPPDHNGWYNQPVTIAFSGSSFSGISSCTPPVPYSGPPTPAATVTGSCTDNAGKTVQATSAPFAYDGTPPALNVSANTGDRVATLNWQMTGVAPSSKFQLVRKPGLHGKRPSVLYHGLHTSFRDRRVKNGVRYTYTLEALDAAGNVAEHTIMARPGRRLLAPAAGAQVTAPPLLLWTAVRRASYYNVQLYRGKHKVMSMWPGRASLQLTSKWRFHHHRYRLRPGTYQWFVWPGYGRRSAARYGHRIGTSTFVVVKS